MRVRLESLGCRLNSGELEEFARILLALGHDITGPGEEADLCIVNSCTVTHIAARKSRQLIRRLRREHPLARIIVTGCYAELSPREVEALDVDAVVGNREKERVLLIAAESGFLPPIKSLPQPEMTRPPHGHTRAFVKVQDGCDNRCTYCVVTIARGGGRSRPAGRVVEEVRGLGAAGYREVVLTGAHLGLYGRGSEDGGFDRGCDLAALVEKILRETDISRLRLSSVEPWDLDEGFFRVWRGDGESRLCRHLHLPLQSGCDETLRRMGRRITTDGFARLVETARRAVPGISVTTDIIVGFPGETEEEFEETLAFAGRMRFAGIHVFKYSPRERTAAYRMPGKVPPQVAQERSRRVQGLADSMALEFRRRFVGQELSVLWETRQKGAWHGLTDNYIRVETPADKDLFNEITPVRLTETDGDGVTKGVLVVW